MGAPPAESDAFARLVHVIDRLLGPNGCPWDQEQTHQSLKRHLLEEVYEVFDAIDSGDQEKLLEELGDLLMQPVMHAQMEARDGRFNIDDVADAISNKLVRRHPHVFGDKVASTSDEVLRNWDAIKRQEKGDEHRSVLEGVPRSAPALLRAHEVSKRAARSGFEWEDLPSVFGKLEEEVEELKAAIRAKDPDEIESEVGDLLFTVVNVARWSGVDSEEALRKMVDRFIGRFGHMERYAEKPLTDLSVSEWDTLWNEAKADENR